MLARTVNLALHTFILNKTIKNYQLYLSRATKCRFLFLMKPRKQLCEVSFSRAKMYLTFERAILLSQYLNLYIK